MIVVDTETTGLYPEKHSIVSIGAVFFSEPVSHPLFYEECRIWDGAEVSKAALAVNGFTEEEIRDPRKQSLGDLVRHFLKWVEDIPFRTIAGENPSFDRGFLENSCERHGIAWAFGHRTVDLHSLCFAHHLERGSMPAIKNGRSDLSTDKILRYVGLPEEPKPHHALVGAKMEAEAFSRLIYGHGLLDQFQHFPVPAYLQDE